MSTVSDPMPATRRIGRITHASAPAPGFAGLGHTAVEVVRADALAETNPFVLLMDDRLDFRPGQPVGEPHPHAGLETVTLVLDAGWRPAIGQGCGLVGPRPAPHKLSGAPEG
jgi:redox-sensitive bicupin YhaK (pirin superfamily)